MAFIDDERRRQLFDVAPMDSDIWLGDVAVFGDGREIVPVRFAGLEFFVLFLSPHAEASHDEDVLRTNLNTLDVHDFMPAVESRMIKFCRTEAEDGAAFKPENWQLPEAGQIFQFGQTLADVVLMYVKVKPHVEQFMFLPASEALGRLYTRTFKLISKRLDKPFVAILPLTGVLHAYERA